MLIKLLRKMSSDNFFSAWEKWDYSQSWRHQFVQTGYPVVMYVSHSLDLQSLLPHNHVFHNEHNFWQIKTDKIKVKDKCLRNNYKCTYLQDRVELIRGFAHPPPPPLKLKNSLSSGIALLLERQHFELSSTLDTEKRVKLDCPSVRHWDVIGTAS